MSTVYPHRGRFQAQGNGLEESESWHKKNPIPAPEGKTLIEKLKNRLNKDDLECRKKAFGNCEEAVDEAEKNGGLLACKKSFYDSPQNKKVRVDLEVNAGLAFIPEKNKTKKHHKND